MYFLSHLRKLLNLFDEFVIDALRLAIDTNDNKESIGMSITKSLGAPKNLITSFITLVKTRKASKPTN